jgi:steroid 5-alpha reductase family enzyme
VAGWIISLPIYFAIVSVGSPSLTILDYLGVVLVAGGLVFEGVGDEQLRRFRAVRSNRGKVLDTGLWRYTRHPNYFGEALVWWGFGLIGVATGGVPGLLGPVVLTYLLLYISGVALLESTLITKAGYVQYVGRTPPFVPLPPQVRMQLMTKLKGLQRKPPPPPRAKWRY